MICRASFGRSVLRMLSGFSPVQMARCVDQYTISSLSPRAASSWTTVRCHLRFDVAENLSDHRVMMSSGVNFTVYLTIDGIRSSHAQGGFQSSWTGRNGGAAADSSRQVGPRNSGTAARRFGTVSISNVTGGGLDAVAGLGSDPSGREESLFDRERRGSPSTGGQSSGVTSQVLTRVSGVA